VDAQPRFSTLIHCVHMLPPFWIASLDARRPSARRVEWVTVSILRRAQNVRQSFVRVNKPEGRCREKITRKTCCMVDCCAAPPVSPAVCACE
jgi:hypothetical protein